MNSGLSLVIAGLDPAIHRLDETLCFDGCPGSAGMTGRDYGSLEAEGRNA
jgi:hypothetical protein